MAARDVAEVRRELSAALFGNRAAVDVVAAIESLTARGESVVTTRMVASMTELGDSVVRPVMRRLHAAGAVSALARAGGVRSPRPYQVQEGELWEALTMLCRVITEGNQ